MVFGVLNLVNHKGLYVGCSYVSGLKLIIMYAHILHYNDSIVQRGPTPTHTHTRARARGRTHARRHTHTNACTHARARERMHTRTQAHANEHTHMHARIHARSQGRHTHIRNTHTHMQTHTHTYIHKHTCTHEYTRTNSPICLLLPTQTGMIEKQGKNNPPLNFPYSPPIKSHPSGVFFLRRFSLIIGS